MKIRAAFRLLQAGKSIRRQSWFPGWHLSQKTDTGYAMYDAAGVTVWRSVSGVDRRADDWEIYHDAR